LKKTIDLKQAERMKGAKLTGGVFVLAYGRTFVRFMKWMRMPNNFAIIENMHVLKNGVVDYQHPKQPQKKPSCNRNFYTTIPLIHALQK
jgi:hypothetical protein